MSLLSRAGWTATASSDLGGSYVPANAINGTYSDFWHSGTATCPHELIIDMGSAQAFDFLKFLPRQSGGPTSPENVEVYVSADGATWGSAVASATFANDIFMKAIRLGSQNARWFKLKITSAYGGYAACAEIYVGVEDASDGLSNTAYATNTFGGYVPRYAVDGTGALFGIYYFWASSGGFPLEIWIDQGSAKSTNYIKYKPRLDGNVNRPKDVEVYVGDDGVSWGSAVASATWADDASEKTLTFPTVSKRWVKLKMLNSVAGGVDRSSASVFYPAYDPALDPAADVAQPQIFVVM